MDRNREARRVTMAATNGLSSRRRHRGSSSLRDSPEEDGGVELTETAARLRERKKDRDREREHRDRDRDRLSRSKRRRADRLIHGSNREDGAGDDTSEESVNDEEDDDDDGGGGVAVGGGGGGVVSSMRMLPPNPTSLSSSSLSNHHHRKSFPPPAKVFRATPPPPPNAVLPSTWKAADEMIGVSVPRKARSASTKRSHDSWVSSGGEQIQRQASTSPVRPTVSGILSSPAQAPILTPASPSSSNASVRKKMKANGQKQRPPKSSTKSTSSAQDEIEFEIAEVLYGMLRQPQGPSKQEIMGNDSRDTNVINNNSINNKSATDAKSRVSSPISNSPSTQLPQPSSVLPVNSTCSAAPMSAIAPKRKRPRPLKYDDENPSIFHVRSTLISSTTKVETDQSLGVEPCSSNLDMKSGSAAENGFTSYDLMSSNAPPTSDPHPELAKPETKLLSDSNAMTEETDSKDGGGEAKGKIQSPKEESPSRLRLDNDAENLTATKTNSKVSDIESQREEKFQIDLMAPPPSRSSPERDGEIGFVGGDPKPVATNMEMEIKPVVKENEKLLKTGKEDLKVNVNVEAEEEAKCVPEETETQKASGTRERNIDLQFDVEKSDRDSGTGSVTGSKLNHHVQKLQQLTNSEKTGQPSSLPLPMSMASWPGGLPPMGYMGPLQGVVSMDGSTVSPAAIQQPPHLLFTQPRPKRCATHCYIARNIHYHQQFTRMNPFWPAAAGSASIYGAKVGNLNVVPPTDLHGTIPGRDVNSVQDKGHGLAIYPGHTVKDKGSQATNMVDAQRKQILLQQALPPGAPSNILHGSTFIFPLGQQQAAAAVSVRPGSVKSPPAVGGAASLSSSSSASLSASATAAAAATAMGFNYPNMPGNETQYLAILQNNPYPFTIPAHVGAAPAYRGTHAQAMPFFNGSFYSSQMLHPSQLPQQQQQPPPPPNQSLQSQQVHQNTSISSGSSSSQKHLQNQQRSHGNGINGGSGALQGFPPPKNQSSQPLQLQHRQQHGHHLPHQARQIESEMGGEDSPSTADSRVSRQNMSLYGQNFAMPIQPPNFALMPTPAPMGSITGTSGSHTEKKPQPQQQQPQQQGSKAETLPQAFAMSFASINGASAAPGFDISTIQNHAILQSFPEAARHGYQIMAAAQAVQQKKNIRVSEEGKSVNNDASNLEEEKKAMSGKALSNVGQPNAFSRPDMTEISVSSIPSSNTVVDSSARNLNLSSAPARTSGSVMPAVLSNVNGPNSQQQLQRNQQHQHQHQHQHQQHIMQLKMAAASRTKTPVMSNGSVYADQHPSSSLAAKFPNALSAFPQNHVQSSSSPIQSSQWKNSVRTTTSQAPSPSLASSTSSSPKNLVQQQGRSQQNHTQISFAGNPKTSIAPQGQQAPNSNQSQSPPMVVGSPTTSISKGAGGSPRTTASTSSGNKGGQASNLSSQQVKNSPSSVPSRKSSPVSGRNISSILGNPHVTSTSSTGTKTQLQQQQPPQQIPKHTLHQPQLFFSNAAYMQAQAQHSASTTSSATAMSGYYIQRNQQQQQQSVLSASSSSGMLSLCPPVTLSNSSTTDPARAAAAASNMKGGGLPSQGLINVAQFAAAQSSGKSHQLLPGFTYVHAVPSAGHVKQAEQKQPAGE
ncbi:hypothetical protein CFOL_v3_33918 [Cephalotus follicularis]|uniref:Protein TIME FOR COFFEE-like n=1 Tax=Cephalotus follicularis TaxID=3775 RepID=A0A1Q3DDL0_CEPFO|nr:hypothetical protein CFOL_v3_33918 [Cephalotus follicularis]